jgi:hypothetical protein
VPEKKLRKKLSLEEATPGSKVWDTGVFENKEKEKEKEKKKREGKEGELFY